MFVRLAPFLSRLFLFRASPIVTTQSRPPEPVPTANPPFAGR
jgi:hypothetical protein